MIHWHGWQILLIDNSCKQKAQLRLMKIEIARCNLAGGERSFVGVGWPQFDHKRNETSWHLTKQNDKISLKFDDTAYKWYRSVHCVFARSTMGFKRPWVRFSPLGPWIQRFHVRNRWIFFVIFVHFNTLKKVWRTIQRNAPNKSGMRLFWHSNATCMERSTAYK